jgi:predicted RNA-binding Zn-ribbon protein involved in translation (DUF1610 family)
MEPHALAAKLAGLKLAPSAQAAYALLAARPALVARYLPQKAAQEVSSAMRACGADAIVQIAHLTCPHCRFSVPCAGEVSASRGGLTFTCPSCQGLTLLDSRDRKFHPLLRCSDCGSLLRLSAAPQPGRYRCRCGRILRYDGLRPTVEFIPEPDSDAPQVAARPPVAREPRKSSRWL